MRLIARDLAGERGGEPLFAALSFTVGAGEALLVTGPNGAGKSTLLRIVAGLLPPAAGSVQLEPRGDHASIASASHYLGHGDAMKPALSVADNLRFWRDLLGAGGLAVSAALDSLGLGEIGHAPFAYLSAGQKRRAAIARLLVAPRPIWLLDEPTAGLDASSEARLGELMQAHRASGGMILAATHQPLGLKDAQELRLEGAEPSPVRAPPSLLQRGSLREPERGGGAG